MSSAALVVANPLPQHHHSLCDQPLPRQQHQPQPPQSPQSPLYAYDHQSQHRPNPTTAPATLDTLTNHARGQHIQTISGLADDRPTLASHTPAESSTSSDGTRPLAASPRAAAVSPTTLTALPCCTSSSTTDPHNAGSARPRVSTSSRRGSRGDRRGTSPPTVLVTTHDSPRRPAVDKVDSKPRSGVLSVTSRAQSRLAALGRSTLRNIVPVSGPGTVNITSGEALPVRPPVSPSDASSHYKRSDVSSNSKSSSETSLSEDSKSCKSFTETFEGSPEGWQDRELQSQQDIVDYERLLRRSPRMMHQTSSKLLRMTSDDRPFTRDFKDLFSTLMVSLPLTGHRVRLSRVEHTFTTEQAITNLGSLKFSQSNRMPDPKDPSRIVTTTTTTTFSMAKEMARSVCMRFLEARFIESLEGKTDFNTRGSVWQLSPKGMHILARFCQRNGINQRHVNEVLDSPRNVMHLVTLERDPETDRIDQDRAMVEVIFRRFAGSFPNDRLSTSSSDGDSTHEYTTGLSGVRMQRLRKGDRESPYVFAGKSAFDWIMDCCTVIDKREVFELANLFLSHELIEPAGDERHANHIPLSTRFAASKHILYGLTQKGMRVAGWISTPSNSIDGADASHSARGIPRDSNTNRMTAILRDPALRLLFREYLRETHCEENLNFFVDVKIFLADYQRAKSTPGSPKPDTIRETLASAYGLYNAFLAPGSPCELNIDHSLRNALANRMTRAVGEDEAMIQSLDEVAHLFEQACASVFKLMASDSVPKFSREGKYAQVLRERNLETPGAA